MYGLVNRAIEQLVISHGGHGAWQRVCERAGVSDEGFLAVHAYPDDVTYKLVGAVSQELNITAEQALEAFGEYWILYTAEEGYGEVLQAGGSGLREFLGNLDEMHGRVESVFPNMLLPSFRVEDVSPDEFRLHYRSQREGLAPMVVGLIKGLAARFDQRVVIDHIGRRSADDPVDVFHIRMLRG